MNDSYQIDLTEPGSTFAPFAAAEVAKECAEQESQIARYLPHFSRMSKQLKQTSEQIETSVVDVCKSFHGIAERARSTVARTADFLSSEGETVSRKQSFEGLIAKCSETLVRILNTTEEAGEISRRAVERIRQMDTASQSISAALVRMERISHENKMLAMNARIEAAHAGRHGAGFAVVAVEVVAQTQKAREVTAEVSGLITSLRELAGSTLKDLQDMNDRDHRRIEECRREVDDSLRAMQTTHGEMKSMLTGMSEEGALLANDIGSAVRGLQFQDRTSQQIAHVVEDLETLHEKLKARCGGADAGAIAPEEGFSSYTMYEERQIAGIGGTEAAAGDVELF
jgi:methyl-accepting chemotaxis protein